MNLTNKHLAAFIEALPGGNVSQYAKLLNTSAIRLNAFLLDNPDGRKLVRKGLIKGPMRGKMPAWATKRTERGVLTANNVPTGGAALQRILGTIPSAFHADATHMFKMFIHMTSGNITFDEGMGELMGPFAHLATEHTAQLTELIGLRDMNAEMRESIALIREMRGVSSDALLRLPMNANDAGASASEAAAAE
jgi:hypothetical protein